MLLLASPAETCSSLFGHGVGEEISPRLCYIACWLLQLGFVLCTEECHGQVAACSKCCSTSGHRDPEIWAWSVYADAWRPALAGYSPASAVQAHCDSPSLSSAPSSRLPRWILRASLWSSWSPASAICPTSSIVSSTSSTWHLWDPCFFCSWTNSLEFTARLSEGSSCRLRTI